MLNSAALPPAETARLRALDVAHHLPAQTDYGLQQRLGGSRVITRAEGSTIWDSEGNAILDAMAGLWCVNAGYGREALARAAYDQMVTLPYYNSFFKTANAPAIELAARIAGLIGGDLQHIFFNSSGSEAADTALRLVRHYWVAAGKPERQVIIARTNAYHGSTMAGVGMGGMAHMKAQGGPMLPAIRHIPQPYSFGAGAPYGDAAFGEAMADALEAEIEAVGAHNVAAFIAEPVQGAGGVIIPPPSYWPRIEAIVRRHGILLIADEVITGFGRLGRWFGHHHYGFTPDVVMMAKGLSSGYAPISAVAASRAVVRVLRESGGEFAHGYTYSGHPMAAAVALANLDLIEREGLVDRVREVAAPALAAALAPLADHPAVGEVRSIGLLGAVEIVADKPTRARFPAERAVAGAVRDAAIARGLMVRAVRDSIVMSPPFIVTEAELTFIGTTLGAALTEVTG